MTTTDQTTIPQAILARQIARAYRQRQAEEETARQRQYEQQERQQASQTWQKALTLEPRLANFAPTLTGHDGAPAICIPGLAPIRIYIAHEDTPEAYAIYLVAWKGRQTWVFEDAYRADTLDEALAIAVERGEKAALQEEEQEEETETRHPQQCPFSRQECLTDQCPLWALTYSGGEGCALTLIAYALDAVVKREP